MAGAGLGWGAAWAWVRVAGQAEIRTVGPSASRSSRRGRRGALGPGPCRAAEGVVSLGHRLFPSSGPGRRVADMTAPGPSHLAPLLETLEDPSASQGEQTDAYLTLTR